MSVVRHQLDAFEEKWEKKLLSGDDHYWLTRPPGGTGRRALAGPRKRWPGPAAMGPRGPWEGKQQLVRTLTV